MNPKLLTYPQKQYKNAPYFKHSDHSSAILRKYLGLSSWITDASGDACTERSRSVNQHLQPACRRGRYLPFGESFIDQRTNHDIRFKFTTKEEDSETGYQYFGARYYASGLSIWLSVDPMSDMYSRMSPYNYCSNNPIMLIDPNGMENIVVVGNQNDKPNSDIKYEDSRHFLEAGLTEAISLSSDGENTTMLVYKGNYTKKELRNYKKLARKSSINFVTVNDADEVINYINNKRGSSDPRNGDLITNLSFISHGNEKNIFLGNYSGNGKRTIGISDVNNLISSNAFTKKSIIKLNSCMAANNNFGDNIAEAFAKKGGSVLASYNAINWGPGLGEFTTHIPHYGDKGWLSIKGTGGVVGPVQMRIQKMQLKSAGLIPLSGSSPF